MEMSVTRREFLGTSGRGLAGLGAAALLAGNAGAVEGKKPFAAGLRDAHLKETGEKDSWSAMKAVGADAVEAGIDGSLKLSLIEGPGPYSLADGAGVEKVQAALKAAGVRISALCMNNRFEERPDFEVDWCARAARAAKALGIPAIRIDVVPQKLEGPAFLRLATETLKKVMEATEAAGTAFAIENHGGTTNDPEFLRALFDGVGSKRLGLTLDTGNFYWFGHPLSSLYGIYEAFAPRVFHTHIKSIHYPEAEREKRRPRGWEYGKYNCPIDEGDIDFTKVAAILRKAGYSNALCIEDESLGKSPAADRVKVLARQIRFLKGL